MSPCSGLLHTVRGRHGEPEGPAWEARRLDGVPARADKADQNFHQSSSMGGSGAGSSMRCSFEVGTRTRVPNTSIAQ